MSNTAKNYVVITPAHNEADYIEITIQAMISQTVRPKQWLIVNDASSDNTAEVVNKYADRHPFIKLINVNKERQTSHSEGLVKASEAKAFNHGINFLSETDFEYIVKLDADLSFSTNYFEKLLNHLSVDDDLGIVGGYCYVFKGGRLVEEKMPVDHVRGPTKMYRKECLEQIGGMKEILGWDTIDEIMAQKEGWKTKSFKDLKVIHLRATSSIDGIIKGKARQGFTDYLLGYHPLFMQGKIVYRLFQSPPIVGSLAMLFGYLSGAIKRDVRVMDQELIKYLRRKQLSRINNVLKRKKLTAGVE